MKKPILYIFILFSSLTIAQITTKFDTIKNVNNVLISQEKSKIIYNRVVNIAKLNNFNATKNISNSTHFEQAISELHRASLKTKFISVNSIREKHTQKSLKNEVDIGILNVKFHQINKLNDKATTKNKKKLNFNGKTSQIIEKEVLVISPLKKSVQGNKIIYYFKKDLLFQENNKKIASLTANFNSKYTYEIIKDSKFIKHSIAINYLSLGHKTLTFSIIFDDGSKKSTRSQLFIGKDNSQLIKNLNNGTEDGEIKADIHFTGYEPGDQPILGKLKYRIFFRGKSNNYERKLKKPIIIIDGFDPLDQRQIEDKDNTDPELSDIDHKSIVDLMTYNSGTKSFIKILRAAGYDVIIVNHHNYTDEDTGMYINGGGDYIERNAMAHISLYQYINKKLKDNGSNEKLIIMGPSMGGLISRYALAYMEENNLKHNTKLWVSIDSPHHGANIPLASQANIYFLAYREGDQNAKNLYELYLNSTAAKQLLISQFSSNKRLLFPKYYTRFQAELKKNLPAHGGFPQQSRNIAIVNGSVNKSINAPGQKVLDVRGFKSIDFLISFISHKGFQNEQWFIKNQGETGTIFYGMVDEFWNGHSMTVKYKNRLVFGSIDAVPGGIANTQGEIKAALEESLKKRVDRVKIYEYKKNHSFIPTVSSLALKNPYFNWNKSLNRDLTCNNEIPFDTYYAPSNNESHVSFNSQSISWLLEELKGNYQPPRIPGKPTVLIGDSDDYNICSNKIYHLKVQRPCTKINIIWKTSSNIRIINNNGENIDISPVNNNNQGTGWVKAIIGDITLSKHFSVGIPFNYNTNSRIEIQPANAGFPNNGLFLNHWARLHIPQSLGDMYHDWEWSVQNSYIKPSNLNHIYIKPYNTGRIIVKARRKNICGYGGPWLTNTFEVQNDPERI